MRSVPARPALASLAALVALSGASGASNPRLEDPPAARAREPAAEAPRWRPVAAPQSGPGRLELPEPDEPRGAWTVRPREGGVDVGFEPDLRPARALAPSGFAIEGAPPLRGLSTGDGWLVGFDAGGGGSLWWFRDDGNEMARLHDGPVVAIGECALGRFAFCGPAAGDASGGSFVRVERDLAGRWRARVEARLGATPRAVAPEGPDTWLVVTDAGVARVDASGAVEPLVENAWFAGGPATIAVEPGGVAWIGARRYLVRLMPFGRRYHEDWFVAAGR